MGDEPVGLPALVFDDADLPGAVQFEVFHETTAPLFATAPVGSVDGFRAAATDVRIDDVMLSAIRCTPQAMRRTARHLAGGATDWVGVVVARRGRLAGEAGRDTGVDAAAGRAAVVDLAHPFDLRADGTDLLWASLPRGRARNVDRLGRGTAAVSWDLDTPEGRAVAATVESVWDEVPTATADDAPALADRLAEVVDQALAPGAFVPSPPALRASMKHFVRQHLDDLELGVEALRATFHCSRSSVYRVFEPEGGVAAFIRSERLQRCFEELTIPTPLPLRISTVATRWGFENPSHFHRLFKAAYGAAPSAVAERARTAGPATAARAGLGDRIDRFHRWARLG